MPTLKQFRQAVASRLGPFVAGAATAGSQNLLEATAWPFKSSLVQDDLYADYFLFRPAAQAGDKTRVVAAGGYAPALGRFTPDLTWTLAPANGEAFELHGLVPPVLDGVNDLHALVNEALKDVLLVAEVTGTPTAEAQRHALTNVAGWLKEPAWVYQVGYLAQGEDRNEIDPFRRVVRGTAEIDGDVVYLNHPGRTFNATDTVWVRLVKPAYHHCRPTGGAFGAQAGLTLDTDEAPPEVEWVVAATLVQCWQRLGTVLAPGEGGRAQQEQTRAAAETDRHQQTYFQAHLPERTFRPLHRWGPHRDARSY